MGKKKLRNIVVDGIDYLWRFQTCYIQTEKYGEPYRCDDRFIAYRKGKRTSPLKISFDTYEDPTIGGPLHCGAPLNLNDQNTVGINLHSPQWAAKLIRTALNLGWQPQQKNKPLIIDDGVSILLDLIKSNG